MAYLDSQDLSAIKEILEEVLQEKLNKLDFRFSNFITKEEFCKKADEVLDTSRAIRATAFK